MKKGNLYMVPCNIGGEGASTIPESTLQVIQTIKYYVAERARTARRFLKFCNLPFPIQEIEIIEIDKHNPGSEVNEMLDWLSKGLNVGMISESGMPGVADPGRIFTKAAHQANTSVLPLVGPSSLLLALSASGMNGQQFRFHGYLPIKDDQLKKKLNKIKPDIDKDETQIFIETPYRNRSVFDKLIKHLSDHNRLCIAFDLTGEKESIKTRTVKQWKATKMEWEKIPCVFLIGK